MVSNLKSAFIVCALFALTATFIPSGVHCQPEELEAEFIDPDDFPSPAGGPPPGDSEDVDLDAIDIDFSEPEKIKRMSVCTDVVQDQLMKQKDDVRQKVRELADTHSISEEKAVSALFTQLVAVCYNNIQQADVNTFNKNEISPHWANSILGPSSQSTQMLSASQQKLLEKVMASQTPPPPTVFGASLRNMSGAYQALWIFAVLGSFFAFAIWGLLRLMGGEEKVKKRSARSERQELRKLTQKDKKKL